MLAMADMFAVEAMVAVVVMVVWLCSTLQLGRLWRLWWLCDAALMASVAMVALMAFYTGVNIISILFRYHCCIDSLVRMVLRRLGVVDAYGLGMCNMGLPRPVESVLHVSSSWHSRTKRIVIMIYDRL